MTIDLLIKDMYPIHIVYKNITKIMFLSSVNNVIYVNVNNIAIQKYPINRWKRDKPIKQLISTQDKQLSPLKSVYSHNSKGTWLSVQVFEVYGNWIGKITQHVHKSNELLNFGSYFVYNKLYNFVNVVVDPFFSKVTDGHIRAHRITHFINITDLFNIHKRELRTWKKNKHSKIYEKTHPHHIGSGDITFDELSMKVTYVHPSYALVILQWLESQLPSVVAIRDNEIIKEFILKHQECSGGGGGGPTKAVNLTDPDTANTLLDQALGTYIGRAANDTEKQMFRKALKEHELKNPSKTTVQGDTAIKSGGSNSATFAKDFAQQQEGSAEFTAATSLMDTFIDALKAQV